MATKKKTTETAEVTEKTFDETTDSKINEDIALIDEDDSDKITSIVRENCTTVENDVKADEDPLTNTFTKLADTIAKAVEKKTNEPKPAPTKKPFKLGLWGYLALVVVVKGAVEITKAVADSKRPRR